MSEQVPICRRDSRYRLPKNAFIDLPLSEGRTVRAKLLDLSVAGLSFEAAEDVSHIEVGSVVYNAVVLVGDCSIRGVLAIRNSIAAAAGGPRFGCHFFPESPRFELAIMALLAGLECLGGEFVDQPPAGAAR